MAQAPAVAALARRVVEESAKRRVLQAEISAVCGCRCQSRPWQPIGFGGASLDQIEDRLVSSQTIAASPPTGGSEIVEINDTERARFRAEHELAETELVFALVGALGTDIERISNLLHLRLDKLGYEGREVHLSSLLREIAWRPPLRESKHLDSYILEHMQAGNRLRKEWKRSEALALLAIAKMATERRRLQDAEPLELRQNRPAYRVREDLVIDLVTRIQDETQVRLKLPAGRRQAKKKKSP